MRRVMAIVLLSAGLITALCIAFCLAVYLDGTRKIAEIRPAGEQYLTTIETQDEASDDGEMSRLSDGRFPIVDWDYWEDVNPDLVGWITIPDTPIDYPIVKAPAEDPRYYLAHDVYREPNACGCPYLDAACEGELFESRNDVIAGHHWADGSLFAALARYRDDEFASSHPQIFVQSRHSWRVYEVFAASAVDANSSEFKAAFASEPDFREYLGEIYGEATKVFKDVSASEILTLYTCSYDLFANERTVVYAVPIEIDGKDAGREAMPMR